jgi:hypothetical protein
MRRTWLLAGIFMASLAVGGAARAEVVAATAQIHAGYADGRGLAGAQQDDAFYAGAAGGIYGARAGVEILFVQGWVEHNQFLGADGLQGTWTQFMAGVGFDFGVGDTIKGQGVGEDGAPTGGYAAYYGEIGLAVGFGLGTGQQVEPPLSNSQLTDKGAVGQLTLGGGYRINELLSVGVQIPVQGAYLFKTGEGTFANDESTHYQSVHASALLNLRLKLGL